MVKSAANKNNLLAVFLPALYRHKKMKKSDTNHELINVFMQKGDWV
jgi:hypothetical protein